VGCFLRVHQSYHCTHLLRKDYALFLFEIKYFLQVSFFS